MKPSRLPPCLLLFLAGALLVAPAALAEDALFIGNSFTVNVPGVVSAIAKTKGKALDTQGVIKGGKNWAFHLEQPATATAIAAKPWNWVVLQDLSTEPTRIGNVERFMADGETLYRKIRQASPKATVVLYQTWAYDGDNALYSRGGGEKKLASPAEMLADLVANYAALAKKLEAIDPGEQVRVAPVGEAFARCIERYPEIELFGADNKHPSDTGRYLSALVICATLYHESPVGAEVTPAMKVKADVAAKLQQVAADVTEASRKPAEKKRTK